MMTIPISQSVGRYPVARPTASIGPSIWLRLLLTGASLLLYPALAAAQMPTVPASAAPSEDGQWTMPAKNYAATRYSALDEINGANVSNLQVAFAFSTMLLMSGCDENTKNYNPTLYYKLPAGATNFIDLGNDWHTFDVQIAGVKRTFMHKYTGTGNAENEVITELIPR